jgi:outer membrane protein TolC
MRPYLILWLVVNLVVLNKVHSQVSLEECQLKARNNFPLIKQFELIEKSRDFTISNANKAFLPQFDITVIAGIVNGFPTITPPGSPESSSTDFQLISVMQLNQAIWDGGITKASKGITEATSEIEKSDLEVSLYKLEDRVNNLFFGILLIDEQQRQLDILKSTLQRNLVRIETAVSNGTAFKSDIDELKVELINADQRITELNFNRAAYVNVLAAMIGEPIDETQTFTQPVMDMSVQPMGNNRPELMMFQNQEGLITARDKINKAMLYPKVGLMGFGTFIQPGVEFGTSTVKRILVAGLSVNWSLGALYKNSNNNELSQINLQKISLQRETFLFNTNLELTQLERELAKYNTLIEQDKELLALKTSIKSAYEIKYENGVSTMSAMLDRVNDESMARQNLAVHEIQFLMKSYQYKNKSGN